jgi:Na+-transporting NADH:ubiquinone oxidoreductase subunit NqrC
MKEGMSIMIVGFITVLVGAILMTTLANTNSQIQKTNTITDKQFTMSNTTCVQVAPVGSCIATLTSIENVTVRTGVTNPLGSANYSLCTKTNRNDGVVFDTASAAINTELNGKTLNATFEESAGCMYVADNTSRTLSDITILMFVIGIIVAAVYFLKQGGLLDMY